MEFFIKKDHDKIRYSWIVLGKDHRGIFLLKQHQKYANAKLDIRTFELNGIPYNYRLYGSEHCLKMGWISADLILSLGYQFIHKNIETKL